MELMQEKRGWDAEAMVDKYQEIDHEEHVDYIWARHTLDWSNP